MNFEVGRLSAALTLDGVPEFHNQLDAAGRKLADTGQKGASFGRAAEAAVRTAAGATTSLTAAAGAYLTILTKQGVAYNSLQQNSRTALGVILGGAEKANEQMAKLDDFARNSPFSKSTFIQAQQQLLGFGMEASKVIPTLDSVQQAMAAMGRSNQDISEVVNILAQVQSTGKLTAETLNQLGYRGLDAAELIGAGMNKTGNEIRDSITKGTLDGREALDILVTEMGAKFAGAADGVKENWDGAVDRIKAAQRDLGAHLAEPFVSAQGGGMAVSWANQVADVLRAIEKQAIPVVSILTQRSMPFFASLTQGLDSAQAAVQRWNADSLEVSLDRLADHAPGIAATAGAVLTLGANVGPLGKLFSTLGISANPVLAAFVGLAAASPELRGALADLLAAGKPLLPVVGDLALVLSNSLNAALPLAADGVELVTAVLRPAVRLLEAVPTPVLAGAAAFFAMHRASQTLERPLAAVVETFQRFGQRAQVQAALGGTTTAVGALSTASMGAKGSVEALGTALKTAFLSNPIGIALTVVATAVGLWAAENARAQQKVQEHQNRVASLKDTLNETTGALTEATAAQVESQLADTKAAELAEKIGVSYRDVQQAVLGNEEAYARVTDAVDKYADSMMTGDANLDTWNATFMAGQGHVRDFSEILEEHRASVEAAAQAKQQQIQADRDAAAAMTDAALSNQRFNDALQVARDITADAETRVRALKQALDELQGGAITAEEAEKRLSETNLTLAEGLAQADENGTKLWQSTLDGAGAIDLSSRAGLAFADSMGRSRDAMLDAALAASDQALANGDLVGAVDAARNAGEAYIGTLQQTMADAGLTQEQIDGLIGKYLDVPELVATLLTTEGTLDEIDQQALELLLKLGELGEGESIIIDDPNSAEIRARLEELGIAVETLPDGDISVKATNLETTRDAINEVANTKRQAFIDLIVRQPTVETHGIPYKPAGSATGNLFSGGAPQAFATGGLASGFYSAPPGMDAIHKFAERELPWEAYISPKPGYEMRNVAIAMEALQRLGHPVIPVSALRGVPAFATGSMQSSRPTGTMPSYSAAGSSAAINLNVNINGAPGQSEQELARLVVAAVHDELGGAR